MKTIFFTLFLFISISVHSQTTDILYVPSQKSLLLTYTNNSALGFYIGGYYKTSFPQPYIYTTPVSIINRGGVNITYKNRLSLMGGVFIKNYQDSIHLSPDIWIKINPLKSILKTNKGFDLDRKSTRLNSSHIPLSRMPSSA